ncbi:hypothetical protein H6G27_34025 [Nostoc linckia FACHB-104]|nr:hypothetical protein [Nostoc linckia FACHB-104]
MAKPDAPSSLTPEIGAQMAYLVPFVKILWGGHLVRPNSQRVLGLLGMA